VFTLLAGSLRAGGEGLNEMASSPPTLTERIGFSASICTGAQITLETLSSLGATAVNDFVKLALLTYHHVTKPTVRRW
jgi:hypothetical protein